MATSATIGSLNIRLSADTAAFSAGLTKAQAGLQKFSANLARSLTIASAAATAALAGVAVAIKKQIDHADDMGKMAQSLGLPVDVLTRLKYVADLSGVSLETLAQSMVRLNRGIADTATSAKGPAAEAFAALGISVKNADGTLRSGTEVLADLADRFSKMEDGPRKTAFAVDLFSRSGAAMIPLLNSGKAGLNGMMQEADKFGNVVSGKTAAAAEKFNDNLSRLMGIFDNIVGAVTANILPTLANLSQRFVDVANHVDIAGAVSDTFEAILPRVAALTADWAVSVNSLARELTTLGEVMTLLGKGQFAAAHDLFRRMGQETASAFEQLKEFQQGLFADADPTGSLSSLDRWLPKAEAATLKLGELTKLGPVAGASVARAASTMETAFERVGNTMERVGQTIGDAFSSAFDSATEGTFKFKDAVGDLLKSLAKLALNSVWQNLSSSLGNAFSGLFGGGSSTIIKGIDWSMPGFASGGSFRVGGSGGIDSQMVAFRATPGEMVDVHHGDRGGGVVIQNHVHNNAGASVRSEQSKTADGGIRIDTFIEKAVGDAMVRRGSAPNRALRTGFGLGGQLTRR